MSTLTVTAKGAVTLKDILRHLGVEPGHLLTIEKLQDGRMEVKAAKPVGRIEDIFDVLKHQTTAVLSIDEIGDLAAQGWAERH